MINPLGALHQNPYECRKMYLALTESNKQSFGSNPRLETTDFDSEFAFYDEGCVLKLAI